MTQVEQPIDLARVRILRVAKSGIQIKPTTDWTIDRLYLPPVVPAQGDVFADGGGGHLTVKWCSRPLVTTQKLVQAALTLGEGCR